MPPANPTTHSRGPGRITQRWTANAESQICFGTVKITSPSLAGLLSPAGLSIYKPTRERGKHKQHSLARGLRIGSVNFMETIKSTDR